MSKPTRVLLAALAGFLLAAAAVAAPTPSSTPSAEDLVARHIAARGGLAKIRAVQTLRQKGRVIAGPGREALVTRELKRPAHTRFEFTVQGVTAVFVSNGTTGWKVSPFEGDLQPEPLDREVVAEAAEQADIEGPLVDWKAKGHRIELVGHEPVAGRDAYKIRITLASGATLDQYLDAQTLNLVRSDSTRTVRGRPVRIEANFSDFKKVKGVLFPRRLEVGAAGRPQRLKVLVDKIEVNPALSDSLFAIPASIRP